MDVHQDHIDDAPSAVALVSRASGQTAEAKQPAQKDSTLAEQQREDADVARCSTSGVVGRENSKCHTPESEDAAGSDDESQEDAGVAGSSGGGAGPSAPLTPEAADSVLKQIEFYFSDASLPSDKKLLKQIRKDPEGYVPIKMFANFRKVRALTRDVEAIANTLRPSTILALSADSKQVKRIIPVPEYDIELIQKRTVVVENLPLGSTIESVTKMMRVFGNVKLVRICSKDTKGKLPTWLTTSLGAHGLHSVGSGSLSSRPSTSAGAPSTPVAPDPNKPPHAYVEYADEEEAVMAVAALHDTEGWRPLGIQVHHLIYESSSTPRAPPPRLGGTPRAGNTPTKASNPLQRRMSKGTEPSSSSPSYSSTPRSGAAAQFACASMIEQRSSLGSSGALLAAPSPSAASGASWRTASGATQGQGQGSATLAHSPYHPLGKRTSAYPGAAGGPEGASGSVTALCSTPSRLNHMSSGLGGDLSVTASGGLGASSPSAEGGKRYLPPGRRMSVVAASPLAAGNSPAARHAYPLEEDGPAFSGSSGPQPSSASFCTSALAPDLLHPSQLALRPIRTKTTTSFSTSSPHAGAATAPAAAQPVDGALLLLQGASQPATSPPPAPQPQVFAQQQQQQQQALSKPQKSLRGTPTQSSSSVVVQQEQQDNTNVAAAAAAAAAVAAAAASTAVARVQQATKQAATVTTSGPALAQQGAAGGLTARTSQRTPTGTSVAASGGAPKFVLDLPPPTNPLGNGGLGSTRNSLQQPTGAATAANTTAATKPQTRTSVAMPGQAATAAATAVAAAAAAAAMSSAPTSATAAQVCVQFQPLSPTPFRLGQGGSALKHLATPFHPHGGQYVAEVEDFINSIIPTTAATSPTPAARPASASSEAGSAGSGGGQGPVVVDEEVARFRAALEEARGVNPASAQAQAYASRALAAAAAGGAAPSPRGGAGAGEAEAKAAAAATPSVPLLMAHLAKEAADRATATAMPAVPPTAMLVVAEHAASSASSAASPLSSHSSSSASAASPAAPVDTADAPAPLAKAAGPAAAAGAPGGVMAHTDPGGAQHQAAASAEYQQVVAAVKPVHLSAAGETTTTTTTTSMHSHSVAVNASGSGSLKPPAPRAADGKALPRPQGVSAVAAAAAAAAGATMTAPAAPVIPALAPSVSFAPGSYGLDEDDDLEEGDEEGEEGCGALGCGGGPASGGGTAEAEAAKRRRRRRGSRAGSRSRRASGSAGGALSTAAANAVDAVGAPDAHHGGGQEASGAGGAGARRPVMLTHHYSDLGSSNGGSTAPSSNMSSLAGAHPHPSASPPVRLHQVPGGAAGPRSVGGVVSRGASGAGGFNTGASSGRHAAPHHALSGAHYQGAASVGGALAPHGSSGGGGMGGSAGVLRRQSKPEYPHQAGVGGFRTAEPVVSKYPGGSAGGVAGEGGGAGVQTGAAGVVVAAGPDGTRGFRTPRRGAGLALQANPAA